MLQKPQKGNRTTKLPSVFRSLDGVLAEVMNTGDPLPNEIAALDKQLKSRVEEPLAQISERSKRPLDAKAVEANFRKLETVKKYLEALHLGIEELEEQSAGPSLGPLKERIAKAEETCTELTALFLATAGKLGVILENPLPGTQELSLRHPDIGRDPTFLKHLWTDTDER